MLEDRPVLQRSLIGFGAFSFVFTAAMAGTAFMISGGFGLGGDERPRPQSLRDYAVATETAWTDWTQPAYAATAYVTPSPAEPSAAPMETESAYAMDQELDGEQSAEAQRIEARSEADILRDIERELTAYESESSAYAGSVDEFDQADPHAEADIIDAKERAAAMDGYGAY